MASKKELPRDSLDEVACGRLPDRILSAIGGMELTLEELRRWQASKPPIRVWIHNRHLRIEANVRLSIKRLLALIAGLGGVLWTVVTLFVRALPTIKTLLCQR